MLYCFIKNRNLYAPAVVRERSYLPYNILKAMAGTHLCLRERRNSQKSVRAILVIEMCNCECKNCKIASNIFGIPGHQSHVCLKDEKKEAI